ncbi:homoserine dehydrogenase [Clostridium cylindrosporum]|uniref:Homoserine dehydrogenase n=1 Tax=Clostridium cylindrosporum DSM 605 TaxID=1121307 RepID=A0A0J8DG58_CLOCY|nr:homoserine dehydrogenase [Clostridium cylindrosporum]KMT23153.1 homoserine dehydrogenase Hom [Clostridium cylindrosporum DSM 605]
MEKVKIGLLGFGTVGSGVWKVIEANNNAISKRCRKELEITKILVKSLEKARSAEAPENLFTDKFEDVLSSDVDIVVEVMGGIEPAKEYILKAISAKKHVVTANKQLLATNGEEIYKAAVENGVKVFYEASVAGGIPILNTLKDPLSANQIEEIIGIVNGTTNYILSKMTEDKKDFETMLKVAQDLGYAEAAPAADVEGFDAAYKLCILSSLAFKSSIDVEKVHREGICDITPLDIEYAREMGYTVKLLAIAKKKEKGLELRVHPTFIPSNHPLASVSDSYNAVFLKGNAVENLMFYGRGAGDLPTASAVVGDIVSVITSENSPSYEDSVLGNIEKCDILPIGDLETQYYVRLTVEDKPGVLGKITSILGDKNVSLSTVIQKGTKDSSVSLVFMTHKTSESNLQAAFEEVTKLEGVHKIENLIRIES